MIDRRARRVVVERLVAATPGRIFAMLADAAVQASVDGSGALVAATTPHQRLGPASTFRTQMRRRPASPRVTDLVQAGISVLIGGVMTNTVVEFEPGERIAWRNLGQHVWAYRLTPSPWEGVTRVTETFDWSTTLCPRLLELAGFPATNEHAMFRTLERLADALD